MTPANSTFASLRIEGWRQFDSIDIELHPRLTVITGANGAGKSSLLRILSQHFGFQRSFLATPCIDESGAYSYLAGIFTSIWKNFSRKRVDEFGVGSLKYSNRVESSLVVPRNSNIQYNLKINNQQDVVGIHIDSHQPTSMYQAVGQIPTNSLSPEQAYNNYNNEIIIKYQGGHTGYSPIYRMKEAIISMAMFGEGNKHIQKNEKLIEAYNGFVDVLKKILPDDLGFMNIDIRPPEVVLVTKSGEFILDASSGGLMTLVDLVWRLYMFSIKHDAFVITIDEPENHLHPTMQRSLMRRLIGAFPGAQFIIATHSPFMVSSVKDSYVYVLRYAKREITNPSVPSTSVNRIVSHRLDTVNKAGSAGEILREVLGVRATIPEWVEESLDEIIERYRQQPLDAETLQRLRSDLASVGYDDLYPDALAELTQGL